MFNKKLYTPFIVLVLTFILTSCGGRGLDQQTPAFDRSQLGQDGANFQPAADGQNGTELQGEIGAINPDRDGSITISIDDEELTQALRALQAAVAQQGHTNAITDPTIIFTNGQIIFSGQVTSEQFSGSLEVAFTPYITDSGLQVEMVSASLDGRNVPPVILQTAEETLNNALAQVTSQLPPIVSLDSVTVQEGELIITGSINR